MKSVWSFVHRPKEKSILFGEKYQKIKKEYPSCGRALRACGHSGTYYKRHNHSGGNLIIKYKYFPARHKPRGVLSVPVKYRLK